MPAPVAEPPAIRSSLTAELAALGRAPGDIVMVHASLRRVGPILGGPDALITALLGAMAPGGTRMAPAGAALRPAP